MEVSATYANASRQMHPRYYRPAARKSFQMIFDRIQMLPDKKEWEGEHEVEMLMLDGTWHWRRIVWTSGLICFTRVGEDVVIESIPLFEADQILIQQHENAKMPDNRHASDFDGKSINGENTTRHQNQRTSRFSKVVGGFFLFRNGANKSRVVASCDQVSEEVDEGRIQVSGVVSQPSNARIDVASLTASLATTNPKLTGQLKRSTKLLQIRTVPEGFNSGRTYYVRFSSDILCHEVMLELTKKADEARTSAMKKSRFQKNQEIVRLIFVSKQFQITVAMLIFANFVVNAAQAQLNAGLVDSNGALTSTGQTLNKLDIAFTCIFTFELLVNAYAHWFAPFFRNQYNLIDIVVISLSLASLGPLDLPASVLRMTRAVRVIRLFGRLKSFKTIIGALTASILPVFNAFLLLLIVISVYAIIGVTYFSELSPGDFGSFDRAFVALFRIPGGDAWVDSLPYVNDDGTTNMGVVVFLYTFILVVNWTLLPITLAILVNNFVIISTDVEKEERERAYREKKSRAMITYPLDPLIEYLTKQYVDDADLTDRLQRLFKELDTDDSKSISFPELCAALKRLDYRPRIHMTELDFASITSNGLLCDDKGMLGAAEFEAAMRKEIRRYAQRQLADALNHEQFTVAEFAQLATLKALSLAQDRPHHHNHYTGGSGGDGLEPVAEDPETPGGGGAAARLHREVALLRGDLHAEVVGLRAEVRGELAALRGEMRRCLEEVAASCRGSGPCIGPARGEGEQLNGPLAIALA